jgi:hypothetical protein
MAEEKTEKPTLDQDKQSVLTPPDSAKAEPNKKSQKTLIIVAVILVFFLIVAISGYFAWRQFKNNLANKALEIDQRLAVQDEPELVQPSKIDDLVDLLTYPDGTLVGLVYDTDYGAAANITLETEDSPGQVYRYYDDLIALNGWVEGSKGDATDESGAWLTVAEGDFRADISVASKKDDSAITEINVAIYSSDDVVTSSRIKPEPEALPEDVVSDPDQSTTETMVSPKGGQMPVNGYVIPDSSTRLIFKSELTPLTPWQLKVARNEIYARHGREFVHQDLSCYFATQNWYSVDPDYQESSLSSIENQNVKVILDYEEEIDSPYLRVDSGC